MWLDHVLTATYVLWSLAMAYGSYSLGRRKQRTYREHVRGPGCFPFKLDMHLLSSSILIFLSKPPACPACQYWGELLASEPEAVEGHMSINSGGKRRWEAMLRLMLPVSAETDQGVPSVPGVLWHGGQRRWVDPHSAPWEWQCEFPTELEGLQTGNIAALGRILSVLKPGAGCGVWAGIWFALNPSQKKKNQPA